MKNEKLPDCTDMCGSGDFLFINYNRCLKHSVLRHKRALPTILPYDVAHRIYPNTGSLMLGGKKYTLLICVRFDLVIILHDERELRSGGAVPSGSLDISFPVNEFTSLKLMCLLFYRVNINLLYSRSVADFPSFTAA